VDDDDDNNTVVVVVLVMIGCGDDDGIRVVLVVWTVRTTSAGRQDG
jgi:hypothetical protein